MAGIAIANTSTGNFTQDQACTFLQYLDQSCSHKTRNFRYLPYCQNFLACIFSFCLEQHGMKKIRTSVFLLVSYQPVILVIEHKLEMCVSGKR